MRQTKIIGILNITPDSFSDGGLYIDDESILDATQKLIDDGAAIIDIGAESTRPGATILSHEEEWQRLGNILPQICKLIKSSEILSSIDTRHAKTAKKAIYEGIDWINDVSGLDDPAMREIIATAKADCVVMHHLSIPERRDNILDRSQDPVQTVYAWGEKRLAELERSGIARAVGARSLWSAPRRRGSCRRQPVRWHRATRF